MSHASKGHDQEMQTDPYVFVIWNISVLNGFNIFANSRPIL